MASSVALIAALVVALPPLQVTGMSPAEASTVQKFWTLAVAREPGCGVRPRGPMTPVQEAAFAHCAGVPRCLATTGGDQSADKVLAGNLDARAGHFSLELMLVDVGARSVQLITSRSTDRQDRLLAALRSGAAEICGSLRSGDPSAAVTPPAEAQENPPAEAIVSRPHRRPVLATPPPEPPASAPTQVVSPHRTPVTAEPAPRAPSIGDGHFDDLPPIPSPE